MRLPGSKRQAHLSGGPAAGKLRVRAVAYLMAALVCSSLATSLGFHGALVLGPCALGFGVIAVRTNERARRRTRSLHVRRSVR